MGASSRLVNELEERVPAWVRLARHCLQSGKARASGTENNAGYTTLLSSQYQDTMQYRAKNTKRALARQGTKLLRWMTPCKKGEELLSVK